MFQTLKNAWKTPELKTKLLFTLLIVVLYRLGANIPVPWVDANALEYFQSQSSGTIFQYLSLLSGDAFGRATLFALSVSPYITASIVMQLLTIAIPKLEAMSKEGDEGRKKISAITRIVTVVLALITAFGYAMYLYNFNYYGQRMLTFEVGSEGAVFKLIVMIACYCAGASLVMWLAERINEHGIGNGISIILFANILARLPQTVFTLWNSIYDGSFHVWGLVWAVVLVAIVIVAVYFVVWFTNSERRIPVQYAKRVVGRKMYGGQSSNLPMKLNMSGVMPIIFANSIVAIPSTIASFAPNSGFWQGVNNIFNYNKPLYIVIFLILLVAFSYFYIMISFNPVEVANNIRNNGGAIPGIRPGKPTIEYIKKILNRITFIGAVFLCCISGLPLIANAIGTIFDFTGFASLAFGGSSLLIVTGVALETIRELESQLTLRNYKGFLD